MKMTVNETLKNFSLIRTESERLPARPLSSNASETVKMIICLLSSLEVGKMDPELEN